MLAAEGLLPAQKSLLNENWRRFKAAFAPPRTPQPVVELKYRRARKFYRALPWAAAALVLVGFSIAFWFIQSESRTAEKSTIARTNIAPKKFSHGEIYRHGKKEIRFMAGDAQISETRGTIRVAAETLKADFRLHEKTDMRIEHPLVSVAITGTEFVFDASPARGTIVLRHGSLSITFRNPQQGEDTLRMTAPAKLDFTQTRHTLDRKVVATDTSDKPLFRYELADGETFYAFQLATSRERHRVHLLGGKEQIVRVGDIVRVTQMEP